MIIVKYIILQLPGLLKSIQALAYLNTTWPCGTRGACQTILSLVLSSLEVWVKAWPRTPWNNNNVNGINNQMNTRKWGKEAIYTSIRYSGRKGNYKSSIIRKFDLLHAIEFLLYEVFMTIWLYYGLHCGCQDMYTGRGRCCTSQIPRSLRPVWQTGPIWAESESPWRSVLYKLVL